MVLLLLSQHSGMNHVNVQGVDFFRLVPRVIKIIRHLWIEC